MATASKNGKVHEELPGFDPTYGYDVDQSTVEEPQSFGPSFPVIQWHYGDPKMVKAGGMDWQGGWFFAVRSDGDEAEEQKAKRAEIGAAMEAAGWESTTWIHDNGSSTDGYWKREIAVSVIALRKCWEVYADSKRSVFPWKEFDRAKEAGHPSSRLHALVLVKGLEDVGPLTLTLKGYGAMYFEGTWKVPGALSHFGKTVIKAANVMTAASAEKEGREPTKWAARCFWLPVGADRTPDGKPKFTEAGSGNSISNLVLPVALGLPDSHEELDIEKLRRFYVGKPLQDRTQELYVENEEWRTAWEEMDTDTDSAPGAHTNGTGPKKKEEVTVSDDQLAEMGL